MSDTEELVEQVEQLTPEAETEEVAEGVEMYPRPGDKPDSPKNRIKKAKASGKKATLRRPKKWKQSPEDLEAWVQRFTPEQQGRAIIHLYRNWPVIDKRLVGERKEHLIAKFDGRFPYEQTEEVPNVVEFIKQNDEWGGSGDYKIMVNETGIPGALSMSEFSFRDRHYPPVIDPRILVVGDPENKGYLESLRARGIVIPGDDPAKFRESEEERSQMNLAEAAFHTMSKQNDRLTEQVKELSEEIHNSEPEESVTEEIGKEIFRTGVRMLEKQVDRVSASQATAFDPIQVTKAAFELVEKLKPVPAPASNEAGVLAIVQTMYDGQLKFQQSLLVAQQEETKYWRDMLMMRINNPQGQNAGDLKGTAQGLLELKTIARELFGREPREHAEPQPPGKNWIETLLEHPAFPQMASGLFGLATTLVTALRPQPGAPAQIPPTTTQLQTALTTPPAGTAPPATTQPPAVDPAQEEARKNHLAFMEVMEKPFIAHFYDTIQEQLNGYTFAYAMHCEFVHGGIPTENGRKNYLTIRDVWGPNFDKALRQYVPIWSQVQGNIGKYTEFLKQFMNYDQFEKEQEALENAKVSPIKAS